jgi:hypothetical protein
MFERSEGCYFQILITIQHLNLVFIAICRHHSTKWATIDTNGDGKPDTGAVSAEDKDCQLQNREQNLNELGNAKGDEGWQSEPRSRINTRANWIKGFG